MEPVPSEPLLTNLRASLQSPKRRVVLISTGAYCPIHKMHVEVFERAKVHLEANYDMLVVAGYISPSHDSYVRGKLASSGWSSLKATQRLELVKIACQNSTWLAPARWEMDQPGFEDFPEVCWKTLDAVRQIIKKHSDELILTPLPQKQLGKMPVEILYLCGSDHALKCRLYAIGDRPNWCDGVVALARPPTSPYDDWNELVNRTHKRFIVVQSETDDMSSSKIREEIEKGNWDGLKDILDPNVMAYMREHGLTFKKLRQ